MCYKVKASTKETHTHTDIDAQGCLPFSFMTVGFCGRVWRRVRRRRVRTAANWTAGPQGRGWSKTQRERERERAREGERESARTCVSVLCKWFFFFVNLETHLHQIRSVSRTCEAFLCMCTAGKARSELERDQRMDDGQVVAWTSEQGLE